MYDVVLTVRDGSSTNNSVFLSCTGGVVYSIRVVSQTLRVVMWCCLFYTGRKSDLTCRNVVLSILYGS